MEGKDQEKEEAADTHVRVQRLQCVKANHQAVVNRVREEAWGREGRETPTYARTCRYGMTTGVL